MYSTWFWGPDCTNPSTLQHINLVPDDLKTYEPHTTHSYYDWYLPQVGTVLCFWLSTPSLVLRTSCTIWLDRYFIMMRIQYILLVNFVGGSRIMLINTSLLLINNLQWQYLIVIWRFSWCRADDGVSLEWSPDGRHFLVATLAPRMRVNNGIQIFRCSTLSFFRAWELLDCHVLWRMSFNWSDNNSFGCLYHVAFMSSWACVPCQPLDTLFFNAVQE